LDEFHREFSASDRPFSSAVTMVTRIGRSVNVTQDQWQDTLSDAAETYKYDPPAISHALS